MASLEEFRALLHEGKIDEAFKNYQLDFNSAAFDQFGDVKVSAYEVDIAWDFQEPNVIKMLKKTENDGSKRKKICYLPWSTKTATSVTLDGNSPPYFVTSHFSNCRFTMKFHDGQGKTVTVLHVAGDTKSEGRVQGSAERDILENEVKTEPAKMTRRLSVGGLKDLGKAGREHKQTKMKAGTTYYDTYARVFGVRNKNGVWSFYAQNINHKDEIIGLQDI
ncbi:hypothetical protein QWY82_11005 [Simiduia curdlanivorans]|uniref:Uncharacterized protein n=1 Tax=Simiduia curdlanivorans TaxID=1492769 RepID=A0ABV8V8U5_9GAMM|nr:hypothetical protein [Simiduia curdlanivorans]MDN3639332.1 hypothetical protein [Simiduia curdlanivorans]